MTDDRLQVLFTIWRRRLGLQDWDIELIHDDTKMDEHTIMRTVRHPSYQRGVVYYPGWLINAGEPPEVFVDLPMTDQRVEIVLVHELLHLYTGRIVDFIEDDLDGQLHRDVHTVLCAAQDRAEEWLVDTLARALVRWAHEPVAS